MPQKARTKPYLVYPRYFEITALFVHFLIIFVHLSLRGRKRPQHTYKHEIKLRPCPDVSGYFWKRSFFLRFHEKILVHMYAFSPIFTGNVWTVGQTGEKNLRFQTKTDMCGRGMYTTRNDPRPQMIPKINLNTTRNDPRPQMIPKFFLRRPEMIPEELSEWNGWRFIPENARITRVK